MLNHLSDFFERWLGRIHIISWIWSLRLEIGTVVGVMILIMGTLWQWFIQHDPAWIYVASVILLTAAVNLVAASLFVVERFHNFLKARSPLVIIFDPANPHEQFWSTIPPVPGQVPAWEYRVKIHNRSSKTVRNVRVEFGRFSKLPTMPIDLVFKKDGLTARDLQPKCDEFVPMFLVAKSPRAGDMWGEFARIMLSPIVIKASGDDVPPTNISFSFCPDDVPAFTVLSA